MLYRRVSFLESVGTTLFENSYIQVPQLLKKKLLVHCIPNIEVTFEQLQDVFRQCDGTIRVLITFKHFFRRHFARMVFRSRDLEAKKAECIYYYIRLLQIRTLSVEAWKSKKQTVNTSFF